MLPNASRSVSSVFLAIFRTRGVIHSHSRAVATFERAWCVVRYVHLLQATTWTSLLRISMYCVSAAASATDDARACEKGEHANRLT